MKKYNIHGLYVVKVQDDDDIRYLICTYNNLINCYVEVFTSLKLRVIDVNGARPFSDYCLELLQADDHILREDAMLDKSELLNKYIEINMEGLFLNDNVVKNAEEDSLKEATLSFFPKEGVWGSCCFKRRQCLSMEYLPCHLRDDLWLTKMLRENQKLSYISFDRVLLFVKTSSFFQEKRYQYEQEIVKWQIEYMRSGGEGWAAGDEYGGDLIFLMPNCDLGFRKGVVDTLTRIGMDIEAIEEGLERNADRWREALMRMAFSNEYEPVFMYGDLRGYLDDNNDTKKAKRRLEPAEREFKDKWLKVRRYDYYQANKSSVDRYGTIEPDMMISEKEVTSLREYLEKKHTERKSQIKLYEQENDINKAKGRVLKKDID